jgi:CDP-6-deoxy-D-xylo-4-hexulose-3-dehydrase
MNAPNDKTKPIRWPLMAQGVGPEEKAALIDFIQKSDRFTNGPEVQKFERQWAEWLGCRYAVFVNSGSSANLVLIDAVREKFFPNGGMHVLSPACTWATNLSTLMMFDIEFSLCDNDLEHFGFSEADLSSKRLNDAKPNVIWVTHLLGNPSPLDAVRKAFPDALIIEDVCESHGAMIGNKKTGTLGAASTFSFYYGHHMTTIEGGMICTDDPALYDLLIMKRSHGMARELRSPARGKVEMKYSDIDPRFMFLTPGFNVRANELNAILGQVQLAKLDRFVERRHENLKRFDAIIRKRPKLFRPYSIKGNSAMALPFLCQSPETRRALIDAFGFEGIETRPFLIGNVQRQPFYRERFGSGADLPNAEWLHTHAFYIGNWPELPESAFTELEEIIDRTVK